MGILDIVFDDVGVSYKSKSLPFLIKLFELFIIDSMFLLYIYHKVRNFH